MTGLVACVLLTGSVRAQTAETTAAAPAAAAKKQLPADQRAFKTARATMDPAKRLEAMRAFIHDYPKSKSRVSRAQNDILDTLVNNFPERTEEIDAQAKLVVKQGGKGLDGATTKTYIAFQLAEAGTAGVDLPYAEKIAKDSVNRLKEAAYNETRLKMYAKFKVPAPKPEELHRQFSNWRAEALAVLADVYLREGNEEKAAPLITEAYGLDPLVDDVNSQRGRLALLQHNDALALESFERAQLVGSISKADRATTLELYKKAHGGSDEGFAAELDAEYAKLYPEPFHPEPAKPVATGRTVLLELFTGSACPPCVGGDLAVEGLLHSYPRSEFVALAFDQHIPEPDPLANPDSLARADLYSVDSTPNSVIDGAKAEGLYGSDRDGSKELYERLTKLVDGEAGLESGVRLKLTADEAGDGTVHAQAAVTLPGEEAIERAIAAKPKVEAPPKTDEAAKAATPAKKDKKEKSAAAPAKTPTAGGTAVAAAKAAGQAPVEPAKPHLVVNFALVEDDVRYSGENGVRFHRMVVRSLAKPADGGFEAHVDGTLSLDASFDPAAISKALTAYLDGFEEQNDRFGKIKFLTKDMKMRPGHLAVAAWVQDTVSHKVLQAALTPLGETQKGAE
jgi:hypothetical protein